MNLAVRLVDRRGFTMVELMVVVALMLIVGGIAAADLSRLKGRYRMNAATQDFVNEVELTRVRAISENREYALVLTEYDPTSLDQDWRSNQGAYEIRSGDSLRNSANWVALSNGVYDLADGPHDWPGISIDEWAPISGPPNYSQPDSLVFSPRGYLLNDPIDFQDGVIRVVFRNKFSVGGEARVVRVNMGGGTQIAATE